MDLPATNLIKQINIYGINIKGKVSEFILALTTYKAPMIKTSADKEYNISKTKDILYFLSRLPETT